MNTEKMSDKMNDLLKFVDLLVKQTCRRAAYDYQMRPKSVKEDKSSIYSLEYLKKIHEKPRENIYKLVKNPQKTLKGLRVDNGFNMQKKDNKFTKIEQRMLLDFVNKVKDQSPPRQLLWIDLQHYLHYVYRNFACTNPNPSAEALSTFFICEMKELLDCLKKEDESQVWLRVFTLLREYCIFAQWHYSKNDEEHALLKFFCYYEAMLTAAKNLVPVFSDFEKDVIYKNYRVCWIDFNTFIFIRFFYESEHVKNRLSECIRTKNSPGDAPQMFTLLNDLKKLWAKEQTRVSLVNQEGRLPESSPEYVKEKKNIAAHKKVLAGNFWVERSKEEKKKIDYTRLDHHIFDLLKDRAFFPEGPGLNKNGQCICEECLIAKYKCFLDSQSLEDFSSIRDTERTTFCQRCKSIVNLELFHRHINGHALDVDSQKQTASPRPTNLTRIISEKMDFVKLGKSTVNLSEMLNEKLRISDTNSHINNLPKIDRTIFSNRAERRKFDDIETTKLAFEQFLRQKKEGPVKSDLFGKNGTNIKINNGFLNGTSKDNLAESVPLPVTAEKLGETEIRLREIRRNGHKPYPINRISKCTTTEEPSSLVCPGHESENPEQKKCDCTYCEVFGTVHRSSELRDRLRIRLHQRREKRSKDNRQNVINNTNNIKASKLETRVPLPSSPTNIPSTPSVSSESSIGTKELTDIHGLVNYIEGNTALNKIELAKKKAAKKARQRDRREQERIEAEEEAKRKVEEQKRKEEEKKREQQRKHDDVKLVDAQMKKKLKKQRQAQKRIDLEKQKNVLEETIPAMVTIKRVANGENGTPSVTITLKGYTPDQDKLLYTLVDEPKEVELKPKTVETNITASKAKKKKSKNTPVISTPFVVQPVEAKVISKEVKVTLAVDKNPVPPMLSDSVTLTEKQPKKQKLKEVKRERQPTEEEIKSLGNLRLPPGITITKVEGPVTSRNYLGSDSPKGSSIVGKSGVIVVDTEKLIQKSDTTSESCKPSKLSKKKKKKSKKPTDFPSESDAEKPKMVTLKNPIFQQYQNSQAPVDNLDGSAPAAIFTSENGMVTIRSSRLQQSLNTGKSPTQLQRPMPLMPELPNLTNPNNFCLEDNITVKSEASDKDSVTAMDAQEILSGLPGIEITKVDKKLDEMEFADDHSCPDAQVSIIPSVGSEMELELDKDDDWLYDSVFKPRDVLEDDMDDEELELEAFKRFCQQSVPPKRKEKVAHLNVADIILKKKTDVKFS